ncbi:MAG: ABC transporter substrate-binding protein [Bacteroidia bacterium]
MIITDQLKRTIEFNFPPKRIISLVPSQSELLWDLDLQEELVGITKFCIHPKEMFNSVKRIGGTKTIKIADIIKLEPDLIIANKEENQKEQIEELSKRFPVYISNINTVNDAFQMITQIGLICNREITTKELVNKINARYILFNNKKVRTVAYLIWRKPYMVVGSGNFINYMLSVCGLINVFTNHKDRYPEVSIEELQKENPDVVLLSSEPYPFKEKHIKELQTQLPNTQILLVDGEMFSWYGSRLLYAFDYFERLIRMIK